MSCLRRMNDLDIGNIILMHKDSPVIELSTCRILNTQFVPYGIYNRNGIITIEEIYKWLRRRAIPLNRKNADKIYGALGQPRSNIELELMLQTHALSINDNYWIATSKDLNRLRWKDINLYVNKLSESLTFLAFTGSGPATITGEEISPEFTGQGTYAKCFRRVHDGLEICKQGTENEIMAEVYSSIICRLLKIPAIYYRVEKVYNKFAAVSKIYTNEHISWVNAFDFAHFTEQAYNEYIYDFVRNRYGYMYYAICLVDGLTLNEDRHLQNWSLQISGDTNELLGVAPLYDFNKSFTGDIKSISNFIPHKNLLSAAKEANQFLQLDLINILYGIIDRLPKEWQESFYNRMLYISGKKSNQDNCY